MSTSSNRILVLDAKTGRLVREVGHYEIHVRGITLCGAWELQEAG